MSQGPRRRRSHTALGTWLRTLVYPHGDGTSTTVRRVSTPPSAAWLLRPGDAVGAQPPGRLRPPDQQPGVPHRRRGRRFLWPARPLRRTAADGRHAGTPRPARGGLPTGPASNAPRNDPVLVTVQGETIAVVIHQAQGMAEAVRLIGRGANARRWSRSAELCVILGQPICLPSGSRVLRAPPRAARCFPNVVGLRGGVTPAPPESVHRPTANRATREVRTLRRARPHRRSHPVEYRPPPGTPASCTTAWRSLCP